MSDLLVLCYHAVSERWPAALSVTPDAFARQLRALRRAGYTGCTFSEAVTATPRRRTVCVTFDDAYRSVLTLAVPILAELDWPATVYAPTDHIGTGRPMTWPGIDQWLGADHERELLALDWDELRELAGRGWEVGSHTRSHPRLTSLPPDALAAELEGSRRTVEEGMATACASIAYPYGDVDGRVVAAAAAAGYRTGAALPASWHGPRTLEYPRVGVYHGEPLWRSALKASPATRHLRARLGR